MQIRIHKIRTRVLLALLLTSLLPLFLMGGYALQSSVNTLRQHSISNHKAKLALLNEQIQMFFQGVQGDLFYLRDSNDVGLYLTSKLKGDDATRQLMLGNLRSSFQKFSQNRGIYDQVRLLDSTGMELIDIQYDGNKADIIPDDRLENKISRYPIYSTLKLPEGGLFISQFDLKHLKDKAELPPRPTIRYGTPLFSKEKQLQGMIIFNTLGKKVIDLVANAQSEGEKLLFISPEGYYYYHPEADKTWGAPIDLNTGHTLFKDYPELTGRLADSATPVSFEQDNNFISTLPIKLDNGKMNVGTLVSIADSHTVFAPVRATLWRFLGIGALVLVLASAMAFWLSRQISRPLDQLTDAVERLSQGETDTPVDVPAYDKTQELGAAIERLRKSLNIFIRRAGNAPRNVGGQP
jgi:HAMP domain-containing protein